MRNQFALLIENGLDLINDQITKKINPIIGFRKKKIKGLYIKGEVGRGKNSNNGYFLREFKNEERKQRLHFP